MKNRIWRRIRKTGIAVATAGAVLSGGFLTETVKSAEIEAVGITIGQSGSWTDKENGRAELNIHVEGIKRWIDVERSNSGYAGCFDGVRCVKEMVAMNENDKRD